MNSFAIFVHIGDCKFGSERIKIILNYITINIAKQILVNR